MTPSNTVSTGTDDQDVLIGTQDSDVIDAQGGDDYVAGQDGNDEIHGGLGSDTVQGGAGEDTLFGDAPADRIFKTDVIEIVEDYDITVTFDFEEAGYRNSLGVYKIDPETGAFSDIEIMWENASLRGSGGDLVGGESSFTYSVEAGEQVGFFLIGNGFSRNNFSRMEEGSFKFTHANGADATVDSAGVRLVHVAENGAETVVNGPIYHTAAYGDRAQLNSDGIEHTMGYMQGADGTMQIGFEDLYNGGDRDFDDSVFTIDIGEANIEVLNAHYENELQEATESANVSDYSYMAANDANDRLEGGQGADTIDGMQGNDLLAGGGAGSEWSLQNGEWVYNPQAVQTGATNLDQSDDVIVGDTGNDVLLGGGGNDELSGGAGNDRINAGTGDDIAYGGTGNDRINLEAGNDYAEGGEGNDIINAGAGDDVAFGGDGNDKLRGGGGDDRLDGGDGQDTLFGAAGDDTLIGGAERDKLFGGAGADDLSGDAGNDHLEGGGGADALSGGSGNDMLLGGAGHDTLSGGDGADKLVGGAGSDTISGGAGNDHLWGGNWSADGAPDTFVYSQGGGRDMIHDFEVAHDQIDLSAYGLSFEDISARITDKGWATEIDLTGLENAGDGDKLLLKSVSADDLDETNFIT